MLRVISTKEFKDLISNIQELDVENVNILDSLGRVIGKDIISPLNIPGFKRSSVDGYAVRSCDTYLCSETMPSILKFKEEIEIGNKPRYEINDMECSYIPTGGMLPVGADSIVMIEDAESLGDEILINASASKGQHVVSENEDISEGNVIFKKGDVITSSHIAALISMGINEVSVSVRVKAGVISTGDELLSLEDNIEMPRIKDTNGPYLKFALEEDGCTSTYYGIIKDSKDELYKGVKKALEENDIVFMSGGSSAGCKDYTEKIMESFGEVLFHGLAIKPGKPTLMAKCNIDGRDKYIVGLPGHPLACSIVYKYIVSALIDRLHSKTPYKIEHYAYITENYHKAKGREEYLPVYVEGENAYPLYAKSSAMSIMAKCNGVIKIERDVEGILKNEKVKVMR
ncbi:MAG: molybdopterin molybdotransferase MoeA [Clostridium sp.]